MSRHVDRAKLWIPLGVVGLVALALSLRSCLYVTRPGYATVIFNNFRGLSDQVRFPGVTWITPTVETPITYNVLTRVWEFTDQPTALANQAGTAITVNSADGQAFAIDVYVALRPNELVLNQLHAEIGENYMTTVVVPVVRSKIRDISASFDSEEFYQQASRSDIETRSQELISQEMPVAELDGQPVPMILIEGIFLGTPNFPPGLKDSIEQKQVASITAQTAGVRAEIQAKETERLLILAEANQQAIELKGEAAALNAQLADLLLYETLEERIDRSSGSPFDVIRVEGDSTVFLNIDSDSITPQRAAAASP